MIGHDVAIQEEYSYQYRLTEWIPTRQLSADQITVFADLELSVFDSVTGKAIPKAMISIDMLGKTGVCNEEGKVMIKKVLSGTYVVDVIVPGYIAGYAKAHFQGHQLNKLNIVMVRNS